MPSMHKQRLGRNGELSCIRDALRKYPANLSTRRCTLYDPLVWMKAHGSQSVIPQIHVSAVHNTRLSHRSRFSGCLIRQSILTGNSPKVPRLFGILADVPNDGTIPLHFVAFFSLASAILTLMTSSVNSSFVIDASVFMSADMVAAGVGIWAFRFLFLGGR